VKVWYRAGMGAPQKQHDWREERRFRAWSLKQAGWKQKDIAQALGVSEAAVSLWLTRGREQGVATLKSHPGPGPQPRLTAAQREQLRTMLAQGAPAFGYHEPVWTSRRVADLIQRTFGVRYHRAHCSRLLRALRQSVQKPVVRANQRDEAAITRWKEERWPALKKTRVAKPA
jgi:transposase